MPCSESKMVNLSETPPKVFISYSHDSQEHRDRIFSLAYRLRSDGIDCNIDQYEPSPGEGWPRWMLNQLDWAEFVLIVCTEPYNRRFRGHEEPQKGKGVTWEGAVITQEIYDNHGKTNKFIPLIFRSEDGEHIPTIIRGFTHYKLDSDEGYKSLYCRLTSQQESPKPPLGQLQQLPPRNRQQFFFPEAQLTSLRQEFLYASKGLLAWKKTLGNNQQIERPELQKLLNRIETEESSTSIILGSPGSGKSALLATLGKHLVDKNYALLAIKADYLGTTVNSLKELQDDDQLNLSRNPSDAVKAVANQERVILLIDQLDALSELLDRQSGRLNVLLTLIQDLANTKNVHIVATCREFEFHHGSQFARLENFEKLDLSLPTWELISPLLEQTDHTPNSIGESLRELLRTPLHLKLFLDVAQPGEVFDSSQKLLDKLWDTRIFQLPEAEKCIKFLETIAKSMTDEEVLWLPSSVADDFLKICSNLEKSGILMVNQDNSTLGFCHQTYYDHTLARAFARGSQSLTDLVLERQDGLFVRPILLRTLNYLRGTNIKQYQRELEKLFNSSIRIHIRTLIIEFIGSQSNPKLFEKNLLFPLLNAETEGKKVLDAIIGSRGWFECLRHRQEFLQWLEKPPDLAVYCLPFLRDAIKFAPENVWNLLEEYWLDHPKYDTLSIWIMINTNQWNSHKVSRAEQVIRRSNTDWGIVQNIATRVAENLPELAPKILRTYLDCRLNLAIEEQYYRHNPFKDLLEIDFYEIEVFAEKSPKYFLDNIWTWFTDILEKIVFENSMPNPTTYREDNLLYDNSNIIKSLRIAIVELANNNINEFFNFFDKNVNSDLLLVHRILARGLERIADQEPHKVLEYLIGDPRRLNLSGHSLDGYHNDTEKLITAICPALSLQDRETIEQAIYQINCYNLSNELPVTDRRNYIKYNRQHRLELLLAFPDECLSDRGKRLRDEELRAFPWMSKREKSNLIKVQCVSPPMTKEEMSRASDEHLLNLFNEISDTSNRESLRQNKSLEIARSGGVSQQSHEFAELIKDDPERFLRIMPKLEPQRHENYVGRAIDKLAETNFPPKTLIDIIESLENRGFVSEDFRSNVASALEKIAKYLQGLPPSILSRLESWLPTHTWPELEHYQSQNNSSSHHLNSSIVFDCSTRRILSNGRGSIVRAIAVGYLQKDPPDLTNWARFIQSQLRVEQHPDVWVNIIVNMPRLLNSDRFEATKIFDDVIRNCPEILSYHHALYVIACTVGRFEPQETVQGWLEMLLTEDSSFSHQAYGELLFIYYFQYQDEWSETRICHHLTSQDNEAVLCGLAHAASHLWSQRRCRKLSKEILDSLISFTDQSVQNIVARFFRTNQNQFELDRSMRQLILAICQNQSLLLKACPDLIEIIYKKSLVDTEPQLVSQVCQSLLKQPDSELTNLSNSLYYTADYLTTIAIKLHRSDEYREMGLEIFEKLLALNLRETKTALETLDRKPNRPNS